MKKRVLLYPALAVFALLIIIGIACKDTLFPPKLKLITSENGYIITNQENVDFVISIDSSRLPESVFTPQGHTFKKNEVIVYQTETTTIYLENAMLSNESGELLYFSFDFDYDLPDAGTILTTYRFLGNNSATSVAKPSGSEITDDAGVHPDSVSLRGNGPGNKFVFYIASETCKNAEGVMTIGARCNQLSYIKGR